MGSDNISYQQRVNDAIAALRGQWTISVMAALALGELPYTELLNAVNRAEQRSISAGERAKLSDRVFVDTLNRAQEHGLIAKHGEPGPFRATRYELTTKGRSLLRAVRPLVEWAHAQDPG